MFYYLASCWNVFSLFWKCWRRKNFKKTIVLNKFYLIVAWREWIDKKKKLFRGLDNTLQIYQSRTLHFPSRLICLKAKTSNTILTQKGQGLLVAQFHCSFMPVTLLCDTGFCTGINLHIMMRSFLHDCKNLHRPQTSSKVQWMMG